MKFIADIPTFDLDQQFIDGLVDAVTTSELGDKVQRIYVFGSYARGEQTHHSDIDLYFVLENGDYTKRMRSRAATPATYYLVDNLMQGKALYSDIIVHTEDEYKTGLNRKWSLEQNVEREGVVIYDRKRKYRSVA